MYWTDSDVALDDIVDELDSAETEDSSELLNSRGLHDLLFLRMDFSGLWAGFVTVGEDKGLFVPLLYLGS